MIKYGDIEYFALLSLNDRLKERMLDRLDLTNIDRLRNEVEMKILEIHEKWRLENNGDMVNASREFYNKINKERFWYVEDESGGFTPNKKSTETTNFEKKRYDKNSRDGY